MDWYIIQIISIHSSQTGWDMDGRTLTLTCIYFNPLIPNGMRRNERAGDEHKCKFQSTHPKRDETAEKASFFIYAWFQSTHPKRDETAAFSFAYVVDCISIHSSQTGWDQKPKKAIYRMGYFNPLIPNGMRLLRPKFLCQRCIFQSTHPKRDETASKSPG